MKRNPIYSVWTWIMASFIAFDLANAHYQWLAFNLFLFACNAIIFARRKVP